MVGLPAKIDASVKVAEASTLQSGRGGNFAGYAGARAGPAYSPQLEKVAARARARLRSPLDSSDSDSQAKRGVVSSDLSAKRGVPPKKWLSHVTARGE